MRLLLPARLPAGVATARLLFTTHPRAFVISAVGTLIEPLFYPALLLMPHQALRIITAQVTGVFTAAGTALIALLRLSRPQARVVIGTRIMHTLPSVPYTLFENNALQARCGLIIHQAAERSIILAGSLLSTPILPGALVFDPLARLAREKIMLFAPHCSDTIRQANTIAVPVDGRRAEVGTHDGLEQNARELCSPYLTRGLFSVADGLSLGERRSS